MWSCDTCGRPNHRNPLICGTCGAAAPDASPDQVALALQRDVAMESHFRGLAFWYRVGAIVFGGVELSFFSGNLVKVIHGGWLPLLVAGTMFTIMTTWQRGRKIVTVERTTLEGPLSDFDTNSAVHWMTTGTGPNGNSNGGSTASASSTEA